MSISSINPIAIATPVAAIAGAVVPKGLSDDVEPDTPEFLKSVEEGRAPVGNVEVIDQASSEPEHQHKQRLVHPLLTNERLSPSPRKMPGPQILAELINRMAGSDVYAGPGQIINISL